RSDATPSVVTEGHSLRFTFVEMLFALAVGQVAIRVSDVVVHSASTSAAAALAHLFLGLMLIATSWFGWKQSELRTPRHEVERLISMQTLCLLLDVLLVILYFVLVEQVDVATSPTAIGSSMPSAHPESVTLVVVFSVYVLWDLLTDVPRDGEYAFSIQM